MTLRQRIEQHLALTGQDFTNRALAVALSAPEPSVRRATLYGLVVGTIREVGKTHYGAYLYGTPKPTEVTQ